MRKFLRNFFLKVYLARFIRSLSALHSAYLNQELTEYTEGWHALIGEASSKTFFTPAYSGQFPGLTTLFSEAQHLYADRQLEALDQLGSRIENDLKNTIVNPDKTPASARAGKRLLVICVVAFIGLAILIAKPIKKKYEYERSIINAQVNPPKPEIVYSAQIQQLYAERTLTDLSVLRKAIDSFHNDNHSYPDTKSIWFAIKTPFGQSTPDWIPGLVPKYIRQLPQDPRDVRTDSQQYMYRSDGKDFKLIAHFPMGMDDDIKKFPELIDLTRPSWAIGFWSEKAKLW